MSTFPLLKTTAVAQYPFTARTCFNTEVLKFVDGSEQRYSNSGAPVRRWVVQLDRLDEGEIAALRQFFRGQAGTQGSFSFTDPVTGTAYPNCSFDQQSMTSELRDVNQGTTTMVIRTNGE